MKIGLRDSLPTMTSIYIKQLVALKNHSSGVISTLVNIFDRAFPAKISRKIPSMIFDRVLNMLLHSDF